LKSHYITSLFEQYTNAAQIAFIFREVKMSFLSWYNAADDVRLGNIDAQLSCFGICK